MVIVAQFYKFTLKIIELHTLKMSEFYDLQVIRILNKAVK